MRRRYDDAGKLLLGGLAEDGRARRRGDVPRRARAVARRPGRRRDRVYRKVVAAYPHAAWAEEAQFLIGWLEFNRGRYREAMPGSRDARALPAIEVGPTTRCGSSACRTTSSASGPRRARLEALADAAARARGRQGRYWLARVDGARPRRRRDAGYRAVVTDAPVLVVRAARARAARRARRRASARSATARPTARRPRRSAAGRRSARRRPAHRARRRADRRRPGRRRRRRARARRARRSSSALRRRARVRDAARSLRKAGNYNRPWMLAVSYGGSALDGPPEGDARALVGERLSARVSRPRREVPGARRQPDGLPLLDHAQGERASTRTTSRTPTRRACCR